MHDTLPPDTPSDTSPDTLPPAGPTRCARIALIGRPNVGKSTLLNALIGQKISITSRKPQTTRHRIHGVHVRGADQFVFVDLPGFQTRHGNALNRVLNHTVRAALGDVDIVLFVVEAGYFGADDAKLLPLLAELPAGKPVILVANKLDRVKDRAVMLPWLKEMATRHAFAELMPLSAKRPEQVQRLLDVIAPHMPQGEWMFDADALTDRSEKFLASEIIREKLFRLTGDELPYTSTVVIDQFTEEPARTAARMLRIHASVVVDREAHKAMIIGAGGERLKRIGTEARQDMEQLFGAKVYLEVWVKIKSGWADDEAKLRSYGYD
ncbi:MAG: GTPase Era [Betaproteobacteria bacterium]|nr:GTPase Era [Betaproteobacteria bacterium]